MKRNSELPSLFANIDLDRDRSIDNRNAGIEQATDHAEETTPAWKERAYFMLCSYLTFLNPDHQFMAEQVRQYAHDRGLPVPPSNRAWGGVMAKAKGAGIIIQIGIGQVKNSLAHRANAAVWKKAI